MKKNNKEYSLEIMHRIFEGVPATPPEYIHSSVVLYGAGNLGKLALDYLKKVGVNVEFIVDIAAKIGMFIDGVPVYSPSDVPVYNCKPILISTASVPFSSVYDQLKSKWKTIIPFYDYAQNFLDKHPLNNGWFSGVLSIEDKKHIEHVLCGFNDKDSLAAYLQFISWRVLREDLIFEDIPIRLNDRYFIDKVKEKITHNENFVDVGVYDGRVLLDFLKLTDNNIDSATLIEPDMENLKLLNKTLEKSLSSDIRSKIEVIQSVVSNVDGQIDFSHGFGFASKPCDIQSTKTSSTRLDTLNLSPTFIKIHTEGSELGVFEGGKETILSNRPIIASTVYHSRDGLWRTPLYLMSLLKDYSFYFRLHSWCGTGAVVYAIPK